MRWRVISSIEDLEKGLVFGNFKVVNKTPKTLTWIGFGKDDLEVDLIDTGKFGEVTKETIQTLMEKADFLPALEGEGSPHRFGITSLI